MLKVAKEIAAGTAGGSLPFRRACPNIAGMVTRLRGTVGRYARLDAVPEALLANPKITFQKGDQVGITQGPA